MMTFYNIQIYHFFNFLYYSDNINNKQIYKNNKQIYKNNKQIYKNNKQIPPLSSGYDHLHHTLITWFFIKRNKPKHQAVEQKDN
jgi:hypothetical protein